MLKYSQQDGKLSSTKVVSANCAFPGGNEGRGVWVESVLATHQRLIRGGFGHARALPPDLFYYWRILYTWYVYRLRLELVDSDTVKHAAHYMS